MMDRRFSRGRDEWKACSWSSCWRPPSGFLRARSSVQSFSCLHPPFLPPAGESFQLIWAPVTDMSHLFNPSTPFPEVCSLVTSAETLCALSHGKDTAWGIWVLLPSRGCGTTFNNTKLL